jgi:diphthamide biosynthesis methyltransferase
MGVSRAGERVPRSRTLEELTKIFGRKVHVTERSSVEKCENHIRRRHILANTQDLYVAP